MLDWLKRFFGFAEEIVSLAEHQAKANRLAEGAVATFTGIVSDLEEAADALHWVAEEAQNEADKLIAQALEATHAAAKNLAAAGKIRGLLD